MKTETETLGPIREIGTPTGWGGAFIIYYCSFTFVPQSNFVLQSKFGIQLFSYNPKYLVENEGIVLELDEFLYFRNCSFGQKAYLKLTK